VSDRDVILRETARIREGVKRLRASGTPTEGLLHEVELLVAAVEAVVRWEPIIRNGAPLHVRLRSVGADLGGLAKRAHLLGYPAQVGAAALPGHADHWAAAVRAGLERRCRVDTDRSIRRAHRQLAQAEAALGALLLAGDEQVSA
jgi:hypothetical protein